MTDRLNYEGVCRTPSRLIITGTQSQILTLSDTKTRRISNRPCVAGAVLQSPLSLIIKSVSHPL